jgi:hypothetical protein
MTLVVQDSGLLRLLSYIRIYFVAHPPILHLYQNDFTPTLSSHLFEFVESTFPGYFAHGTNNWQLPTVAAHVGTLVEVNETFTVTSVPGPQFIYGYYLTDQSTGDLLWAERDPNGPFLVQHFLDSYTVKPEITLRDQSVA